MAYYPPVAEMRFVLRHVAGIGGRVEDDILDAVLEEAAKLAAGAWAPLNRFGDSHPPRLENGGVAVHGDFRKAYGLFVQGGWNGLVFPEAFGGQGLPAALGMAVDEMWQGANIAFGLCPMLTRAAVEAILHHGSDAQKQAYLPKLVSGEWTGTMQLTEPQAGTDLSAIRATAKRNGDHYLLKGQKIFITWGDHGMTDNIIHLVLAHVDGLPEGNDGLGLFIVPKFLPDGARNDVGPVSLEHKLGLHASPTCVMAFGEKGGAVGYIVGEEGAGLRNMFTMMNNARINVGVQGVGLGEAAFQHALAYARERVQCAALGDKSGTRVAIVNHPDVKRMLLTMRAQTEAGRAMAYYAGGLMDRAKGGDTAAAARIDFMTPLIKAYCTDCAVETASLGIQVHGGMGYVEEAGAAQFYRDARILPIYEGTNGIQSGDFLFRKILRDKGAEAQKFMAEIRDGVRGPLAEAAGEVERTTAWILGAAKPDPQAAAAVAQPFQRQWALFVGGWLMSRLARAARDGGEDADFSAAKISTADFFLSSLLPHVHGLGGAVRNGKSLSV